MQERQKLLSFLRTKRQLQESIRELKNEYLVACGSKPPIYISDHSMVRYLERVKHEDLKGESEWDKVYNYLRRKGLYSQNLREEIFNEAEMRHIVSNEIEMYEKHGYIYVVKGLTLITVYKKEKNGSSNSTIDSDSSIIVSSDRDDS